jgi:type II secretory pathway pseudopilin PulG
MIKQSQIGDTIIEVLLSMSVIGLVLGAAFGIANRSVSLGQEAQERSEALKIAESQLEIFKSEYFLSADLRNRSDLNSFCFDQSSVLQEATDPECTTINGNGQDGLYSVSIIPPSIAEASKAYEIRVTWLKLGDNTASVNNNLSLYFKPGSI